MENTVFSSIYGSSVRILSVCTSTQVYGAEKILLALLGGLATTGHQVEALTTHWADGRFDAELMEMGIPFRHVPLGFLSASMKWPHPWWTANCLFHMPQAWVRFTRARKEFNPDIVHLTSIRHVWNLLPCLSGIPCLLHAQFAPARGDPVTEARWLKVDRKLAGWIVCSDFIGLRLAEFGIHPEKIHVVKSASIHDGYGPILKSFDAAPEKLKIGIIGQVGAWKGHEDLIEAVALLGNAKNMISIEIYGDGDVNFRNLLHKKIDELGLKPMVQWHGYQDSRDDIFNNIDICVVPSRSDDPYPTVALEAAWYGKPTVASAKGGLPEIVCDGVTGYIVSSGSPEKLADRLNLLIHSKKLREDMGRAARERAESFFTVEQMTADFIATVNRFLPTTGRKN